MKKDRFTAIGNAAALLGIIIPLIMLCFYVGQQTKQIEINTTILRTVSLKTDVEQLRSDNSASHIAIKQEISNLDDKIDTYILKIGDGKKVTIGELSLNPYFNPYYDVKTD